MKLDRYALKRKGLVLTASIVRFIFICCVSYLFLFPVLYLLISAIQTPESLKDQSVIWIPREVTLMNFKDSAEMLQYGKSLILTLSVAFFSTAATLLSCGMAGYALARFNFAEKRIVFVIVLILIIVPPQTTMMSTFLNFRFFNPLGLGALFAGDSGEGYINLIDSPITMILPAIFASGIRSGLMIFIFRQFFLSQPKELEEAAKIDGCGIFKTYFKIMLPLASPAIITVAVFSFVWYWNDSFYSSLFFNGDLKPLTAQLSAMRNTFLEDNAFSAFTPQDQKVLLSAGALLCLLPPLILYMIIQRKFSESIERVGIVG